MKLVVQVFVEREGSTESLLAMTEIQRNGTLQGATLRLTLAESKTLFEFENTQRGAGRATISCAFAG
jgi:hypothetical protein